MLLSISEGVLLDKAVAMGLVSAADVAEARNANTASPITRTWGLVLDRLIAQGKLTEAQLRRLQEMCIRDRLFQPLDQRKHPLIRPIRRHQDDRVGAIIGKDLADRVVPEMCIRDSLPWLRLRL